MSYIISSDGKIEANWGEGYGTTWRNLMSGLDTSPANDWQTNKVNQKIYADVHAVDNEKRIKADIDVLQSIAHFFEGKTVAFHRHTTWTPKPFALDQSG